MKELVPHYSNNSRQSGLELLRIIAMLMVVTLHYLHENLGGVLGVVKNGSVYYFSWTLEALCYCAVNVFVLISGYFLCERTSLKLEKVIDLLLLAFFYSSALYFAGCISGITTFHYPTYIARYLFPVSCGLWWFVTDYVILYLLAPYLNVGLKYLTKEQHRNLVFLMITLFSIIPTVIFFQIDVIGIMGGYSFIWFVTLYVVAAYIRRFGISIDPKYCVAGYLLCSLLTAGVKFGQETVLNTTYFNLYKYNSVTVLGASVFLLCFFIKVTIDNTFMQRIIKITASVSFAVFLLHTHSIWSKWLWDVVKAPQYTADLLEFIPHMILSICLIYIATGVIDIIRQKILMMLRSAVQSKE